MSADPWSLERLVEAARACPHLRVLKSAEPLVVRFRFRQGTARSVVDGWLGDAQEGAPLRAGPDLVDLGWREWPEEVCERDALRAGLPVAEFYWQANHQWGAVVRFGPLWPHLVSKALRAGRRKLGALLAALAMAGERGEAEAVRQLLVGAGL